MLLKLVTPPGLRKRLAEPAERGDVVRAAGCPQPAAWLVLLLLLVLLLQLVQLVVVLLLLLPSVKVAFVAHRPFGLNTFYYTNFIHVACVRNCFAHDGGAPRIGPAV